MPILRFVDSIAASPTVRLDLAGRMPGGGGSPWFYNRETRFPPPPLRRSISTSMLVNGDYVGADAYGNRELQLVLTLDTASANTGATELQKLQRELDRDANILQYSPGGATQSVFFRTVRSQFDQVQFDPTRKTFALNVMAEPFALGIREDLGSVTLNNNPAAGSNGLYVDLTGIKGDVETPILIETTRGATYFQRGMAIGVRPKGVTGLYPTIFRQAEALTMGTSTTVVADAAMSGGSKARCTFSVGTMLTRVSGKFPTATAPAGAENLGTYRVFCRVARTVGADSINMRVGTSLDNGTRNIYNTAVPMPSGASTSPVLMDLGVISIGDSMPDSYGYDPILLRAETLPTLLIEAENLNAPSGNLDIDYVCLVPADYRYGKWSAVSSTSDASARAVIDSINEVVYGGKGGGGATPGAFAETTPSSLTGGFPTVLPGDNRLVIVDPDYSNDISATNSIVVRYWPRYLLVRPVST